METTSPYKKENNHPVLKLNIETLTKWIDIKFNNKYKSCLESLRERFAKVYSIIKIILESIIELNSLLKNSSDQILYETHKPLIENIVRLLDMTINEFPEYLDLEFVEAFFSSIQERIQIFWAHFHQILHIQSNNMEFMTQFSKFLVKYIMFYYISFFISKIKL